MLKWKNETRRSKFILIGEIFIYIIVASILTINRHNTFRSTAMDLGWFMQAFWNTIQGNGILKNTIMEMRIGTHTHFGAHLSPILLLLVPIYVIFPKAETLLILQSIVIGIAAYPLYLFAKEVLRDEKGSILLSTLYLFNSSVHGVNFFDFHAVPFSMPFIFLLAYYMERNEYKKAILSAVPIMMVKEDAGIALVSIGMFYLLKNKSLLHLRPWRALKVILNEKLDIQEKASFLLILMGSIWIFLGLKVVVPYFSGGIHITFTKYYSGYCPQYIPYKLLYFITVNLSLGMLIFIKPKYAGLLTFLPWLEILAACKREVFRLGFQYPYMLIPLSFIGIIYALSEIPKNEYTKILRIGVYIGILVSLVTTPFLPPVLPQLHGALGIPPGYYMPQTSHIVLLENIVQVLNDSNLSILTQNDIFPHLANRENTYLIWSDLIGKNVTYLTSILKIDVILLDSKLVYGAYNDIILPKDLDKAYIKVFSCDGIELYVKRNELSNPKIKTLLIKLRSINRKCP